MRQIERDWRDHPITRDYIQQVENAKQAYMEAIINSDVNKSNDIVEKIGVVRGLEALLTYEPQIDDDGAPL